MGYLQVVDRGGVTVQDPLHAFAEFLRLNVAQGAASPDTLRSYRSIVKGFYEWAKDCGVDPGAASRRDVLEYRRHLIELEQAPGTINLKINVLRRFYEAARWWGIREDNPLEGEKPLKNKQQLEDGSEYLTQGQLGALFHAAKGNTLEAMRDRLVLALGSLQGLRCVEIHRLRRRDVMEWGGHPLLHVRGKTRDRRVYLRRDVKDLIDKYMNTRRAAGLVESPALVISLANGTRGQAIGRGGLRAIVVGYLDAIGVKGRSNSTHLLRHSYATITLAAGAELRQVQESMGHADPRTTARYAHATERAERNPALFIKEVEL